MITYECAALGFKNGLSIEDMATVLNRSSGANSATEHVLPFLADRQSTSDALLSDMVFKLRLVSQLAMRAGTPIVLSNLVADLCQSASNQLGSGALVDSLVGSVESSAGVTFN
jgi:3-hydroxyisobutyrate dehydrogenase